MQAIMTWQDLRIRIAWNRCNRRRWAATRELPFTPEQRRKRRNVLLYFWAGEGWRRLPEGEVAVRAGICHWSRPGWSYACRQAPEQPLGITAIHFDLVDADGRVVPPDEVDLPPEVLMVRQPHLVEEVTSHVALLAMESRAGAAPSPSALAAAETLLRGLLAMLAADLQPGATSEGGARTMWPEVSRYLHDNLQAPPTLTALAARWGYTRSHFSRLFAAHFGLPPHRYLLNARLALAKELLRDTELPVAQVAELAGFADPAQFARRFRQATGLTATAYRQQER